MIYNKEFRLSQYINKVRACAGGFFKDDVSPFTDLRRSPLYRAFPRCWCLPGPFTEPSRSFHKSAGVEGTLVDPHPFRSGVKAR